MKSVFIILFILGFSMAAQALDRGYEVRLALTQSGYEKLFPRFTQDSNERVDVYFEAWKDQEFILKPNRWKLRLKQKTNKYELQVSQISKTDHFFCGSIQLGLTWTNEGRKDYELKSPVKDILDASALFFTNLRLLDPKALGQVGEVDSFLKSEKFPGKKALEWDFQLDDLTFVPAKFNRKIRGKLSLNEEGKDQVNFVLGRTIDADEDGVPQIYYELEAEGEGDPDKVASVFCNLIIEAQLKSHDVNTSPKPDAAQLTLKLLNMLDAH